MESRFHMSTEENLFVVRRNISDYIWKSAKLEGFEVTYAEVEAILQGLRAPPIRVAEIIAVNNLYRAWKFILENACMPMDMAFICQINRLVGGDNLVNNAGFLRQVPVSIGGTSWRPELPVESKIKEELAEIQQIQNGTEQAITLMLYLMRRQMFLDGNKRTAMLSANKVMIAGGCGIISVPLEYQPDFMAMLVKYYETNDQEQIANFVYDHCIDGIDFEAQRASEPAEIPEWPPKQDDEQYGDGGEEESR